MIERRSCAVVLCVGGFDPSGGAGLLLDAAAVGAAGAHAAGVTAIMTLQHGGRFVSAEPEREERVRRAIETMLASLDVRAVKTGALGSASNVRAVAEALSGGAGLPLVVDPVLRSSTGGALLDAEGLAALRDMLLPLAAVVTPNLDEAEALTGLRVRDPEGMLAAARRLVERGAVAALVKGGHLAGPDASDAYADRDGDARLHTATRSSVGKVRGTGCALASLVAGFLAGGEPLPAAIERARRILGRAIAGAVRVGNGPPVLGPPIGPAQRDALPEGFAGSGPKM